MSPSSSYLKTFLLLTTLFILVNSQIPQNDYSPCDSLICAPPKKCVIKDELAQCKVDEDIIPGMNAGIPNALTAPHVAISTTPLSLIQSTTAVPTTADPLAPLLGLFSFPTLPTLPTLPPPTTAPPPTPLDICTLPPVTGSCSRARIMWYFDTETGRCERFSYSGCGNGNRFSSRNQCTQRCSHQFP